MPSGLAAVTGAALKMKDSPPRSRWSLKPRKEPASGMRACSQSKKYCAAKDSSGVACTCSEMASRGRNSSLASVPGTENSLPRSSADWP